MPWTIHIPNPNRQDIDGVTHSICGVRFDSKNVWGMPKQANCSVCLALYSPDCMCATTNGKKRCHG
jgi:hypothetical protein